MKTLLSVVAALALGFAGAYYFVNQQKASELKRAQAGAEAELARLNEAVANSEKELNRLKTVAANNALTPRDLLIRLATISPAAPEGRSRRIREIIHHLESLIDARTNAIMPMRQFIAGGQDVDYVFSEARPPGPTSIWNWHPGAELSSGLVLPPTLRISLVDVFRYIGGDDGVSSLAWMLNNSARGVEVYYIAQALESIAPGVYTQMATQRVKELLQNPASDPGATKVDSLANSYLYAWLTSRGDTSMVEVAEKQLFSSPGRIDIAAARYLESSLKSKAMPILEKAYAQVTDTAAQTQLANLTFTYVGDNPAANNIFKAWLLAPDADAGPNTLLARPRSMAILLLAGGNYGIFKADAPTDPRIIAGRIALLEEIRPRLNTGALNQAADQALQSLRALTAAHN